MEDIDTTCILGRDLLSKFGATEFNWKDHQIRIGDVWKNSQVTIERGEPLARACMLMSIEWEDFGSNGVVDSRSGGAKANNTSFDVTPELTPRHGKELISLLYTYSDVFAETPKRPAMATGAKHVIDTSNAQPVKQKLYPVTPSVEEEIMRQVNEMLANGICRPSSSSWASRVLLVTKRDEADDSASISGS